MVRWDRETNDSGVVITADIPVTCCNMPGDYPNYGPPYDSNCTTEPTEENSHYLKVNTVHFFKWRTHFLSKKKSFMFLDITYPM